MAKGVDGAFLHYGIRTEDMQIIESIAIKHGLDFEWIKTWILKEYHTRRVNNEELTDHLVDDVIKSALRQIN